MGSRLTLPLLLLAALGASGLFWWLAVKETPVRPEADVVLTGPADEPESAPVDLVQPEVEKDEPRPTSLDRTVVSGGDVAPRRDTSEEATRGTKISGRVVDDTGAPIEGATILATDQVGLPIDLSSADFPWMRRYEATSAADGTFSMDARAGDLRVAVRASGFAPYDEDALTIPADPEVQLDPFVVDRGAILSGHVLDPNGGGVAGAELMRIDDADHGGFVVLGGRREPVAVTEADGSFTIDQIACGPWKVQVQSEDHPDRTFEGIADVPGVEVSGLEFALEPGASISGRVTDVPDTDRGKLVVRASRTGDDEFMGRRRTAEVDSSGSFTLSGLDVGAMYELKAQRQDDEDSHFVGWFGRTRSESVRARAGSTGVVLPYQPEGALTFQVLDSETRAPLTDFEVEAGIGWPQRLRGEDGKPLDFHPDGFVRVGNLRPSGPDERVQLIVRSTGYADYRREDLAVANGQEVDLGIVYLDPIPVVRVTVLDAQTKGPIAGARVNLRKQPQGGQFTVNRTIEIDSEDGIHSEIFGGGQTVETDENGQAVLSSLQGELCALTVRADDHARFELRDLALPIGDSVDRTIELTPGGSVVITVLGADELPVAGARVQHRRPSGQGGMGGIMVMEHGPDHSPREVTDSKGQVTFENLEPGFHSFRIAEASSGGMFFANDEEMMVHMGGDFSDSGEEWSEIEVLEGQQAALTLIESPRGLLTGTVREAGRALAGADLRLAEKKDGDPQQQMMMGLFGGGGESVKADGKGEFSFTDVKEGEYTLTVDHPTRRMPTEFDILVKVGDNRFDVDLSVSVIEGRITDPDGKGIPGLTVQAERKQKEASGMRGFAIRMETDGGDTVISSSEDLGGESVTTDDDGRYTLRGVAPDVELVVKAEGKTIQPASSESLSVAPDEVRRNVDFTAELGGEVEVEVVLSDGSPARFCLVNASYLGSEEGIEPKFGFVQSGSTKLSGLRPGLWNLNVTRAGPGRQDGDAGVDQEVEIRAGETAQTTVRLD